MIGKEGRYRLPGLVCIQVRKTEGRNRTLKRWGEGEKDSGGAKIPGDAGARDSLPQRRWKVCYLVGAVQWKESS